MKLVSHSGATEVRSLRVIEEFHYEGRTTGAYDTRYPQSLLSLASVLKV